MEAELRRVQAELNALPENQRQQARTNAEALNNFVNFIRQEFNQPSAPASQPSTQVGVPGERTSVPNAAPVPPTSVTPAPSTGQQLSAAETAAAQQALDRALAARTQADARSALGGLNTAQQSLILSTMEAELRRVQAELSSLPENQRQQARANAEALNNFVNFIRQEFSQSTTR
jgi:hypothetical protein